MYNFPEMGQKNLGCFCILSKPKVVIGFLPEPILSASRRVFHRPGTLPLFMGTVW